METKNPPSMMPPFVAAMRPHQWVKNLLVMAPLAFTPKGLMFEPSAWAQVLLAFAAFCLAASSIYLLNDIVDREEDARHPKKRHRPIASGRLPVGVARAQLVVQLVLTAALSLQVPSSHDVPFWVWPLAYLTLNLAYSFWLKRMVVIDCMCIALGFQLRVQAGAAAIDVAASHWLLLCTFFFALFLAFCKRYEELSRQSEASGRTRATMEDYTASFLNMMIGPLAALSILSYSLYTVSPETVKTHGTDRLMFTVPIVTYGVFRYLFLVYRKQEGGDPARLLFRDVPLLVSGAAYGLLVLLLLRRTGLG
ncbi:MAG: decaprenyl-phosphate phosphoribosyltransferase [Planctomycetes bacterium]|nr:decaprenyl-phosphate phosphoribosyltransferase [Planctomycetota bacterium]MCC7396395.1 decaprenyl-phosphate phosphoribosyltransferase [Planctomycetota bacterium]